MRDRRGAEAIGIRLHHRGHMGRRDPPDDRAIIGDDSIEIDAEPRFGKGIVQDHRASPNNGDPIEERSHDVAKLKKN
jgi:hypothetical protein